MQNLVNKTDNTTAEIYLYGIIGSSLDIDTNIAFDTGKSSVRENGAGS